MAVRVLANMSDVKTDKATIVLASDVDVKVPGNAVKAIEELRGKDVQTLAISHASAQGMRAPRVTPPISHPYAANKDGRDIHTLTDKAGKQLPAAEAQSHLSRYQTEIVLTATGGM